jgi:hypothetical protein
VPQPARIAEVWFVAHVEDRARDDSVVADGIPGHARGLPVEVDGLVTPAPLDLVQPDEWSNLARGVRRVGRRGLPRGGRTQPRMRL